MKTISAELVTPNRRERISGGVQVEFYSEDNVKKNDFFIVIIGDKHYPFKATGIKVEGDLLKITAIEVGYWAQKIDSTGVDLRTVIGVEIESVTDVEHINRIHEQSCWC